MPFNSYAFIFVFLPVSVTAYWLLAGYSGRNGASYCLILASIVFYVNASWMGIAVITPSILLDYWIASTLLHTPVEATRKRNALLALGITSNLAILAYFKYRNFLVGTVNSLFSSDFDLVPVLLPLGISFLTFQKIAFLADVRAGTIEQVRFRDFLLFTTLFPRTIAGPIVRYAEVVPQLDKICQQECDAHLSAGIALFSVGLFKKAFIADRLSAYVTPVFDLGPVGVGDPGIPTLITSWLAVLAYTFQLYFDFSGYSDMALGTARMFGIRLPMNFNSPLKATSIIEFWARWHITLTRFLTAYIYTPLVMYLSRRRIAKGESLLNGTRSSPSAIVALIGVPSLTTMTVSGFWHGAGWQFVAWGVLHGIYITTNQTWRLMLPRSWKNSGNYIRVMRPIGFLLTITSVMVALVFFRAHSLVNALRILYAMFGGNGIVPTYLLILRQAGVAASPELVRLFFPIEPWAWIVVLLLAVTLLPNSLEMLRASRQEINYVDDESVANDSRSPFESISVFPNLRAFLAARVAAFNPLAAIVTAVLFFLGTLMLSQGEVFIYWNF